MFALIKDAGFFTSMGQALGFLMSALIIAVITFLARIIAKLANDVKGVTNAIITAPATPFNPTPPPGLIEIVNSHSEALLVLMADVKTLVDDSKTNGGKTSRDAINRIEQAVSVKPD